MKFPICLVFAAVCFSLAFGQIAPEGIRKLKEYEKHCTQLSGTTTEHLQMARLDRKIHEEEHLEKFAVCMLKKFNIMEMDGSINAESTSYFLLSDNPESGPKAKVCIAADTAGTNVRERARKIMNCLMETTDIFVIDPYPEKSFD